ncbi:MAG: thiamine pyrophosphate-binding protein [Gemmatimonadota bacterium]
MRLIHVLPEEEAAFVAVGYAKLTDRLVVRLAASRPGSIHFLNGLYDENCDDQPVMAIPGHSFHDLSGMHDQQHVDLDKRFMDVAASHQRVMSPAHVPNVVDEAIRMTLAQRTVVHITIPKDVPEWRSSNGA